jgi:hypothetical protein
MYYHEFSINSDFRVNRLVKSVPGRGSGAQATEVGFTAGGRLADDRG